MFINYISLMLVNLVAGLALLASYVYFGLNDGNPRRWIAGFGVSGAIALVTGLHMVFTWPVTSSFNIAFGEASVLFGILFVGTSLALALGWDLFSLAIYGFFAGVAAVVIGARIINLGLTRSPTVTGVGFILAGLGGIFAAPTLYFQHSRALRLVGALVITLATLNFAFITLTTYWAHLGGYSDWQPLIMRSP